MSTPEERYGARREAAREKAGRIVAKLAEAKPWAGGDPTWADVADMHRMNDLLNDVLSALGDYRREDES